MTASDFEERRRERELRKEANLENFFRDLRRIGMAEHEIVERELSWS